MTYVSNPSARAALSNCFSVSSLCVLSLGLMSAATRVAAGRSSRRSARRFATNSAEKKLIPVTFALGRLRLATSLSLTGSSATANTIGMVAVVDLAAIAAAVPGATMTSTLWRTRSCRQLLEAIVAVFRPADFDQDVRPSDEAAFT